MTQTSNASESILPAIAEQERELLAQIRSSEEEARNIIEKARSDAREYRQERETGLAEEVAKIRHEAEEARLQKFQETVGAAEQALVNVRVEADRRVPETARKVLSLLLPPTRGEN